jgi:hypothetical protein
MDKNHYKQSGKVGRPRLTDSPIRRYWRQQKQNRKQLKKGEIVDDAT